MPDIWLISDTHMNHANILKFTDNEGNLIRPGFEDVNHMNEHMIECWNSVIKPGDKVYHLGDVTMGHIRDYDPLHKRLNGKKRLVNGNHENAELLIVGRYFQKICSWFKMTEFGLILSHYVLHESNLWDYRKDRPLLNVHGHIHQNDSPPGPYKNVCVEKVNYTPVNIDEIRLY